MKEMKTVKELSKCVRQCKSNSFEWIIFKLSPVLPVVFPDLGGPTTAILTGRDGVGFGCLRYFKGFCINMLRFFLDAKK